MAKVNPVTNSLRRKKKAKASKTGAKKGKEALARQNSRTKWLNALAGEINKIIDVYSDYLKPSNFYQRVQRLFRKEASDNRLLLLWRLKQMDVNLQYPLRRLGTCRLNITAEKNNLVINLQTESHPTPGKHKADHYYYEVILLCWDDSNKAVVHSRQYSDWMDIESGHPQFEFSFPQPAGTIHWLVCLKQQLCKGQETIGKYATMGMQIAEVGTCDKNEQALLNARIAELKALEKGRGKKPVKDVPRVKAKMVV